MAKAMVFAAAVMAAVTMVGAASASAAVVGQEKLTVFLHFPLSGPPSVGSVVATGPVNGGGQASLGGDGTMTVTLASGTLFLDLALLSEGVDHVNRSSCVDVLTGAKGITAINHGTGVFAGATGGGNFTADGTTVLPRNPDRSCIRFASPSAGLLTFHFTLSLGRDQD